MKKLAWAALAALVGCGPHAAGGSAGPEAWQTLFDGQTLNGWETRGAAGWRVENGYLTPVPGSGDGFLVSTGTFADFRLQVEFWADDEANGGVYFRIPSGIEGVNPSFEVNIMDSHRQWPTGSISSVARVDDPRTAGRWASFDITMRGDSVSVLMDGRPVAAGSASREPSGHVGLQQLGPGVIRYRNIRISPL